MFGILKRSVGGQATTSQAKHGGKTQPSELKDKLRRRSCETCRTRKVRCSGELGSCTLCFALGVDCIYAHRARKSRARRLELSQSPTDHHFSMAQHVGNSDDDKENGETSLQPLETDFSIMETSKSPSMGGTPALESSLLYSLDNEPTSRDDTVLSQSWPESETMLDFNIDIDDAAFDLTGAIYEGSDAFTNPSHDPTTGTETDSDTTLLQFLNQAMSMQMSDSSPIPCRAIGKMTLKGVDENLFDPVSNMRFLGDCGCISQVVALSRDIVHLRAYTNTQSMGLTMDNLQLILSRCGSFVNCAKCAGRIELHVWLNFIFQNLSTLFLHLAKQVHTKHQYFYCPFPAASL